MAKKQLLVEVSVEDLRPKAGKFAGKTVHDALVIRPSTGENARALKGLPFPEYIVKNLTEGKKKQVMYKTNKAYKAVRAALTAASQPAPVVASGRVLSKSNLTKMSAKEINAFIASGGSVKV